MCQFFKEVLHGLRELSVGLGALLFKAYVTELPDKSSASLLDQVPILWEWKIKVQADHFPSLRQGLEQVVIV